MTTSAPHSVLPIGAHEALPISAQTARPSTTAIDTKDLARGDIVAYGAHVEIVTSVNPAAGTFCSRGGFREPMGGEKCADSQRQINQTGVKYIRVK